MDPDENLRSQKELANKIVEGKASPEDSLDLAELVLSMDEWIRKGGFLPAKWLEGQDQQAKR